MKTRIVLRGVPDGYSSYSFHWMHVVRGLGRLGYDVNTLPIDFDRANAQPLPSWAAETIVHKLQAEPWEMVIHCPSFAPPEIVGADPKRVIYNTMWESTRIAPDSLVTLNNCHGVVVPSRWQQTVFSAQGVTAPMYVVPMGVDTEIFVPRPAEVKDRFIFGAAGRTMAGGCRKAIPEVVAAFRCAFPGRDDVALEIKCYPEDPDICSDDPRVKLIREFWDRNQLADWYQHIDCFVSASRGEGWGLMQHEAMATGRPVIAVPFGGITEFFDEQVGFPVDYTLIPGDGHYEDRGHFARADFGALIDQMEFVANGGAEVEKRTMAGALRAAKFSWDHSNSQLVKALASLGVIDDPNTTQS